MPASTSALSADEKPKDAKPAASTARSESQVMKSVSAHSESQLKNAKSATNASVSDTPAPVEEKAKSTAITSSSTVKGVQNETSATDTPPISLEVTDPSVAEKATKSQPTSARNTERPVRHKLQKASLGTLPGETQKSRTDISSDAQSANDNEVRPLSAASSNSELPDADQTARSKSPADEEENRPPSAASSTSELPDANQSARSKSPAEDEEVLLPSEPSSTSELPDANHDTRSKSPGKRSFDEVDDGADDLNAADSEGHNSDGSGSRNDDRPRKRRSPSERSLSSDLQDSRKRTFDRVDDDKEDDYAASSEGHVSDGSANSKDVRPRKKRSSSERSFSSDRYDSHQAWKESEVSKPSGQEQIAERPGTPEPSSDIKLKSIDAHERVLSPKKKRSRDQFDLDQDGESLNNKPDVQAETKTLPDEHEEGKAGDRMSRTMRDGPEKKRHRDNSQEAEPSAEKTDSKVPATSGFADTSEVSPFGSLGASKGPSASPFGALGASGGFGALGAGKSGGFGSAGRGEAASAKASPVLGFGGGVSGFGALGSGSGFGFGGGFASKKAPLSSFASKAGPGIVGLSEKPARPFGAPEEAEEDEEEDGEEDGESGSEADSEEAGAGGDKRLQVLEVETGEEGEETVFAGRSKLYFFHKGEKAWKERGTGTLKLNVPLPDYDDEDLEAGLEDRKEQRGRVPRLLMRAEGVYRVVLNVPIFREMQVGDADGRLPSGKTVLMTAMEDGSPVTFQVRFGSHATAVELCNTVEDIKLDL
ncbi:MAG: hypothetical protein M1825_003623 [Sarcosagium campestre]|nr:MAG: hypothetical protein M1825_003623 [Sarcosagium campestre]